MPGDVLSYALMLLVVFVAAIVQSCIGMGFGLVVGPVLLSVEPALVPSAIIIMGTPVGAWATYRGRHEIVLRELWIASAGRMLGALMAAQAMVMILSPEAFKVLFALVILLAVGLSFSGWNPGFSIPKLFAAGLASGVAGTVSGYSGPPLALVYQNAFSRKVRATMNATLTLGGLVSLGFLWIYDLLPRESFGYATSLVPALVLGIWCSKFLSGTLDQRLRSVLLVICGLYAVVTLVTVVL